MGSTAAQLGWAVVRLVFGLGIALFHGYGKVFEGRVAGLVRAVSDMGFPWPTFFAWAASLSELLGGALVAVGLGTRAGAAAVCATMAVALYRHLPEPMAKSELALLYLAVMTMAVLVGGGRFSLDALLGGRLGRGR